MVSVILVILPVQRLEVITLRIGFDQSFLVSKQRPIKVF